MTTRDDDVARRCARHLDRGLPGLDPHTLARLRSARESALERLELQTEPTWAIAGSVGGTAPLRDEGNPFTLRRLVSIAALLAAIGGMVYWQQLQHEDPLDIDAKLLSGDLPIDAYLDKGLDAWLNR
jgi:hypothetical protein